MSRRVAGGVPALDLLRAAPPGRKIARVPNFRHSGDLMKSKVVGMFAAALATSVFSTAFAAEPAKTRAEVKAEARAATKAGDIPHGEALPKAAPGKSTKTRAERKAETQLARKRGELAPAGTLGPEREPKVPKSDLPRAPIKAETRAAVKAGTIPRGEAPAGAK